MTASAAAAARSPPEWSKWWWLGMTNRMGLVGIVFRTASSTALVRPSPSGASNRTTWSVISMATL